MSDVTIMKFLGVSVMCDCGAQLGILKVEMDELTMAVRVKSCPVCRQVAKQEVMEEQVGTVRYGKKEV